MKILIGIIFSFSLLFSNNKMLLNDFVKLTKEQPMEGLLVSTDGEYIYYNQIVDKTFMSIFKKPFTKEISKLIKYSSDIGFCEMLESNILLREGVVFKVKLLELNGNEYFKLETSLKDCNNLENKKKILFNFLNKKN